VSRLFARPAALAVVLGSALLAATLALWWYWGDAVLLGIATFPSC
jgi:hypothetical protein